MNSSNWLLSRTVGPWCHTQLRVAAMHIYWAVWTRPTVHLPLPNGPWLQCFNAKHGSLYTRDKLLMRLLTFHHNYFLWERLGSPVSLRYVLMDQTRQELDTECSPFTSTRRLLIEAPYCLILLSHTMLNHTQNKQNADWVTLYNHCTLA